MVLEDSRNTKCKIKYTVGHNIHLWYLIMNLNKIINKSKWDFNDNKL
jgi:hypothetical protein